MSYCRLLLLLCCTLSTGCKLTDWFKQPNKVTNQTYLFSDSTTTEDLIGYLNQTHKIDTFASDFSLELTTPDQGVWHLRDGYLLCRPTRDFRMTARLNQMMTSDEMDFGSNKDQFWFYIKRMEPTSIYYCSYDDFDRGVQLPIPLQPEWVLEVLGLGQSINLNGDLSRFEKKIIDRQQIELSEKTTIQGQNVYKVIVFNRYDMRLNNYAQPQILDYKVLDSNRKPVMTAKILRVDRYLRDGNDLTYPSVVQLEYPQEKLKMKIDFSRTRINVPFTEKQSVRFMLPDFATPKDLAKMRMRRDEPSSRRKVQPAGAFNRE